MIVAEKPTTIRTTGARVCKFIETHCVFTNGEWVGRPFRLLPWQRRLIYELFETGDDGLRRFRWALVGIPKKNGKTELAAALGLYFLLADGEASPLVVCAAASDDQADLVFGAAKKMCELSPTLSQITECYEREIQVPSSPGAVLKRVAAVAGTNDGLNIHAVICDELHEWKGARGENVWNVLTNGTGARKQPVVFQITTAGFDLETVCGRQYEYGKKIEAGEVQDRRYFFRWWAAPEGADHRDPAVWEDCNPSYGVTVYQPFFEDQLTKKTEAVFRRYFMNEWTAAEELWLPAGVWEACNIGDFKFDPDLPLYAGWDAARRRDSTAVVAGQRTSEGMVRLRSWIWERPVNPTTGEPVEDWETPTAEIMNTIRELDGAFDLRAVGYDPWGIKESVQQLTAEGIAMDEVGQSNARMVPATEYLYELICDGKVEHDGNPTFARHMRNIIARQVPSGVRMDKGRARKPMDAGIAAAIVAYLMLSESDQELGKKPPNVFISGVNFNV